MSAQGDAAHEPGASYDGPGVVLLDGAEHPVEVRLRGEFQPIDGRFHWYGRVSPTPSLAAVRSGAEGVLRTAYGEAGCRLSDVDPWGRFRITGTGRPPF